MVTIAGKYFLMAVTLATKELSLKQYFLHYYICGP